ncbi:hypothetical protein [Pararoseomonas baculiformis]|nr:hypothetical protein [Pararoseomonas baculiformis]
MELLPSLKEASRIFAPPSLKVPRFGEDTLVINVRLPQSNDQPHAGMRPLPISFYARLVEETRLCPVFMGQLGRDPYSEALRARFPLAKFIPSMGAMEDFATIRLARHVVCSVSTFSWLAAWLSRARTIHLPMIGFLHPQQRPDVNLLPITDARYRFYDFGPARWPGTEEALHAAMHGDEAGEHVEAPVLASRLHGIQGWAGHTPELVLSS